MMWGHDLTLLLYTVPLLLLVCPDVLSPVGERLSADGVVHRTTYGFLLID